MDRRLRTTITVGALASAALTGAAIARGQVAIQPSPVFPPVVLSGADIGFRMTARKGNTPVGQLLVRVDGEWREVEFSYGLKPLTSR